MPPKEAQRLSHDDPGAVFVVTRMTNEFELGRLFLRSPFTLHNWQAYRQVMERVGVFLPELEPPRELSPVGEMPVDCHFDFEMPEFFIENPPCPNADRSPFEIELHSEDAGS